MSGFKQAMMPWLIDANGAPIGVKEGDGDETMIPRFSPDLQSLLKPDGSALAGTGGGYVLPVATASVLGGVKAGSGVSIAGDGTISAAGGGSATFSATADEALAARALVYIKSNGNLANANATAEGKEALGFVQAAVSSGAAGAVAFVGNIITGFTGLTPGAGYYLSTTNGAIVNLAGAPATAGNVLQKVGTALSTTALLFSPEPPITL